METKVGDRLDQGALKMCTESAGEADRIFLFDETGKNGPKTTFSSANMTRLVLLVKLDNEAIKMLSKK